MLCMCEGVTFAMIDAVQKQREGFDSIHGDRICFALSAVMQQNEQNGHVFMHQALPAPAETYGKDANGILRAIMRVKERPDDIMEKFEQFYHAIDAQEYTLANEILGNLDEILGDDPDLTAMHIQLDLEQM